MIDLFTIFSKGGIVLWCFQGTSQVLTPSINALVKGVFLQERGNVTSFNHNGLTLKFKLDNEFELVFLVAYQSIIQLSYVDKLLSDVQREFRDRYKDVLMSPTAIYPLCTNGTFRKFDPEFQALCRAAENAGKNAPQVKMRTFEESLKSQKTIASMIEKPGAGQQGMNEKGTKKSNIPVTKGSKKTAVTTNGGVCVDNGASMKNKIHDTGDESIAVPKDNGTAQNGTLVEDEIAKNREAFFNKMTGKKKPVAPAMKQSPKAGSVDGKPTKKGKQARTWPLQAPSNTGNLDYSTPVNGTTGEECEDTGNKEDNDYLEQQRQFVGKMKGELEGLEYESDTTDDEQDEEESEESDEDDTKPVATKPSGGGFGMFSAFKSLVGSKKLTGDDIKPCLDKMKDLLIAKNVAADIADKLCQSVASKLEGKVIGTFSGVASTVKAALRESLVQLLSPRRRVDILRDVMEAKRQNRPYTVVFCGVNGVGKSTNLAKVTFWLNENGFRVLIAACDTFRAGAVEQLRTHVRHLNHLHPQSVQLYEQGYGKDPAAIAAHAINSARDTAFDVVLVDTAGRMQDNEPLMRALAKLIRVNDPDLVLFVGEALVGNEAVDQLTKFNQALADHSTPGQVARLIDGIVLTKFDTIDDKVGAAISMTYITGQPIVFVGTGQTYNDLKNLNANAVVHALLK